MSFYETGDTLSYGTFRKGKQVGTFKAFYESGKLKELAVYKEDELHGPKVSYRENGLKEDSLVYKNGEIVEEFHYFDNGTLRMKAKYHSETDKDMVFYKPDGEVSGKIKDGTGEATMWVDDGEGGYRSRTITYKDGDMVFK